MRPSLAGSLVVGLLLAGCVMQYPMESAGGIDPTFPAPPPAHGSTPAHPRDVGDVRLVWSGDAATNDALRGEGEMDDWIRTLNEDLAVPRDIPVRHTSCGITNAYYSPEEGSVTLCYELLDFIARVMSDPSLSQDEIDRGVGSVWLFVALHEIGHALVDAYDLPITGREEDAVDDLATLTLIEAGAANAAVEAAIFWILTDDGQYTDAKFADEHSLNAQRFYAILCTVYGSDPEGWASIVEYAYLSPERAQRCVIDYDQKEGAWDRLLEPWRLRAGAAASPASP